MHYKHLLFQVSIEFSWTYEQRLFFSTKGLVERWKVKVKIYTSVPFTSRSIRSFQYAFLPEDLEEDPCTSLVS